MSTTQTHCPRCGLEYPPSHIVRESASTLDEHGNLIEEEGIELVPVDWIQVGEFSVCPDCATLEEQRRQWNECVRCGREDDGDEVWITEGPGMKWYEATICPGCATPDEDRKRHLAYLLEVAAAIATTRARDDWDGAAQLDQPESWSNAVEIMCERCITNHLHRVHPVDPMADPEELPECWDVVSDQMRRDVMKARARILDAKYPVPAEDHNVSYSVGGVDDWWLTVDWWQVERTIRRYVHELRATATSAGAGA